MTYEMTYLKYKAVPRSGTLEWFAFGARRTMRALLGQQKGKIKRSGLTETYVWNNLYTAPPRGQDQSGNQGWFI